MSTSSGRRPCYPTVAKWMFAALLTISPLAASPSHAQAIEYVVFSIEGTVEDISLGQVLQEGYRLEIPENASVDLVSKQGEIITLDGPVVATVTTEEEDEAGERALASISDLLFEENQFVQTIGVTRSTGKETDLQKLLFGQDVDQAWNPVISDMTDYCVAKGSATIRRARADTDLAVQVKDGKELAWKAGTHELNLDLEMASLPDNASLKLDIDGRTIQVFSAPAQPSSIAEQAAWMASKGCKGQALKLLASKISN